MFKVITILNTNTPEKVKLLHKFYKGTSASKPDGDTFVAYIPQAFIVNGFIPDRVIDVEELKHVIQFTKEHRLSGYKNRFNLRKGCGYIGLTIPHVNYDYLWYSYYDITLWTTNDIINSCRVYYHQSDTFAHEEFVEVPIHHNTEIKLDYIVKSVNEQFL